MSELNYYELLGVSRTATTAEITRAYREKALYFHPDKNKTDPDAAEKFKQVNLAFQVLLDPLRRKKYDMTLPAPADWQPH